MGNELKYKWVTHALNKGTNECMHVSIEVIKENLKWMDKACMKGMKNWKVSKGNMHTSKLILYSKKNIF